MVKTVRTSIQILDVLTGTTSVSLMKIVHDLEPPKSSVYKFVILFMGALFLFTFIAEIVLWIPKPMGYRPGP